jgi:hypothetical protein
MTALDPNRQAGELRRRASSLRRCAVLVEDALLGHLARLAGDATWYGPTAGAFADDCRTVGRLLSEAADDLRRAAIQLDHQAVELERAALVAGPVLGG